AGRSDLFEGLSIWQEEEYRKLQGTYPVVFLSFANVKDSSFASARKKISRIFAALYTKCDFLLEGDCLSRGEKERYELGKNGQLDEVDLELALNQLSDYLCRYYGKKVIILLDEYDTPMQEAYVKGYWEEMSDFMRSLFNSTFKTNSYLYRALMTGITRVSRESIFSDFNNPKIITTTSVQYEECFGFTEEEVFAALEEYGLSEKKEEVKSWYDGFTFGTKMDIYNPWSIINYLDNRQLGIYWANTSSNSLAGKLIQQGAEELKQDFETLLQGGTLETELNEQLTYGALSQRTSAVWSLLLASGYLKVMKQEFLEETGRYVYTLALTNREVKQMFETMIQGWFQGAAEGSYNKFLKALLSGDEEAMNEYMNRVTEETFSYFDTGTKPSRSEPERFYHGFV
ncbi:MAG: AAA family ATPase, partial [Firmicutes bacterium]|nr:AAA family ATPase [Bacillota bacterium]